MKKQIAPVLLMISLCGIALAVNARPPVLQFHSAQIASTGEIAYPPGATSSGTLVFDVWVSANGTVENVQVRRALEPFTEPSLQAIRSWRFRPATLAGKPVASSIAIAATFSPRNAYPANVPLPPLAHEENADRSQSGFQPADVLLAVLPQYPAGAINPGTVVLECSLNEAGAVESTKVVSEFPPYTGKAVAAVASWKFRPATLRGSPVSSSIVLAFVFPTLPVTVNPNHH